MSNTPAGSNGGGLIRALGPVMATAVVVGTVIGSGVFKKPGGIADKVPYTGLVATLWVVGGLLVILGALAYAEVCVLLPRAGGNYVFLREGYGRLAGFLWGWVEFWIIRTASIAALATIFIESLNDILKQLQGSNVALGFWGQKGGIVAAILFLTAVNMRGVRWGGGLQVFITVVKVGSLLAILALPVVALALTLGTTPSASNFRPMWPDDWSTIKLSGLGAAFLGVLWAYHGWMNIAPIAEEVRRPQRNLPLALLLGVGIVVFLYLGANVAYYSIIPTAEMAPLSKEGSPPVVTVMFLRLLGPIGTLLASGALMCSVFGALNGNLLVGPRLLYAMGEDRLAPRALRDVHPRWHTPANAIAVMGGWAALMVLTVAVLSEFGWIDPGKSHFDRLTDFAMFGAVIFETMAVVSIFVLRWKMPDAPRPYRCVGYPLTPALYVVVPGYVLYNYFQTEQTIREAQTGVGFIVVGIVVYYLFGLGRQPAAKAGDVKPQESGPGDDGPKTPPPGELTVVDERVQPGTR
jgi:amino acid transporter